MDADWKSFDWKKLHDDVIMELSASVILSIMNRLQRFPQRNNAVWDSRACQT